MADKIFADGIYYDLPIKAPEFIKGRITIDVAKFDAFVKKHKNGDYIRLDVKESKAGKLYIELNTWTPSKKQETPVKTEEENLAELNNLEVNPDDIPF